MSDFRELLLGCGHSRVKRLQSLDGNPHWHGLVTLDYNENCDPDIVCNLNLIPWKCTNAEHSHFPLPELLGSDYYDEIHAYEILEHLGQQGDADSFFATFGEIWRILKPGGILYATVPSRFSPWLWGDPSHRRAILPETLVFLDQSEYVRQLDGPEKTPMSDFRSIWKGDFRIRKANDNRETFAFALEAVKPSRCTR